MPNQIFGIVLYKICNTILKNWNILDMMGMYIETACNQVTEVRYEAVLFLALCRVWRSDHFIQKEKTDPWYGDRDGQMQFALQALLRQ